MARPGNKPSLAPETVRAVRRLYLELRASGRVPEWKVLAKQLGVRSPAALRSAARHRSYLWVQP